MARYKVLVIRAAKRDMKSVARQYRATIKAALRSLADNPAPHGVVHLRGPLAGYRRIRVGDFRVMYTVRESEVLVLVVMVGKRGEYYEAAMRRIKGLKG